MIFFLIIHMIKDILFIYTLFFFFSCKHFILLLDGIKMLFFFLYYLFIFRIDNHDPYNNIKKCNEHSDVDTDLVGFGFI